MIGQSNPKNLGQIPSTHGKYFWGNTFDREFNTIVNLNHGLDKLLLESFYKSQLSGENFSQLRIFDQ